MAAQQVKAKIESCPETIGKGDDTKPNPALERVGQVYECTVDLPANHQEMIDLYGGDLVYNQAMGAITINLQSAMRTCIKSEDFSEANLQAVVAAFKPQLKKAGVSFSQKVDDYVEGLSDEGLAELLERVKKSRQDKN